MGTVYKETFTKPLPAAAYIRMSGRQQDKSPAEQRAEITKLATREGFSIVEWFTDEAITGDSSIEARFGLAALLTAAKAGAFKVVLAWHTNRVSREDPMDAIVFYNQLRKAGVGLHTCCEGAIDLEDFAKQLLLFINQKASNDFLIEMSAKTLRGRIANAKAGGHNGGPAVYAMDRGLFRDDGHLVRRLQPGEYVRQAEHRVHLLPGTDQVKIDAVRFAFRRFDGADIGVRDLARQLQAKGYPSPNGKGWTHDTVRRLLRTAAYVGTVRWGATAWGKYHEAQGDNIVPTNGNVKRRGRRWKALEDAITVDGAHEGIIPIALFNRVQRKLPSRGEKPYRPSRRADYPLSGLIFCGHCGQPMYGNSLHAKDRHGSKQYEYHQYICSTYANRNGPSNSTCGRHPIDAARVLGWLVHKLQEVFLGPGRDALVQEIKKQLQGETKANSGDVERLQKRAADLEREVSRLVKAIRTLDAAELVEELALVQAERDRVKAEIVRAGRFADPVDLDSEAERIADGLWEVGQHLNDAEPAVLRELLRQFVSRITCRWETSKSKSKNQTRSRLVGGTVELREQTPLSVCGVVAQAT
jgi:DNA invertase Pin-like site-specific DNA recombinase